MCQQLTNVGEIANNFDFLNKKMKTHGKVIELMLEEAMKLEEFQKGAAENGNLPEDVEELVQKAREWTTEVLQSIREDSDDYTSILENLMNHRSPDDALEKLEENVERTTRNVEILKTLVKEAEELIKEFPELGEFCDKEKMKDRNYVEKLTKAETGVNILKKKLMDAEFEKKVLEKEMGEIISNKNSEIDLLKMESIRKEEKNEELIDFLETENKLREIQIEGLLWDMSTVRKENEKLRQNAEKSSKMEQERKLQIAFLEAEKMEKEGECTSLSLKNALLRRALEDENLCRFTTQQANADLQFQNAVLVEKIDKHERQRKEIETGGTQKLPMYPSNLFTAFVMPQAGNFAQ